MVKMYNGCFMKMTFFKESQKLDTRKTMDQDEDSSVEEGEVILIALNYIV